jgi:hypothetical protein
MQELRKRPSDWTSTGTLGFQVPSGCLKTWSTSLQQPQQSACAAGVAQVKIIENVSGDG